MHEHFDGLDDFAGPGGWDEGASMLGLRLLGVEWDEHACATAEANGHARIHTDVATHSHVGLDLGPLYVASPPCTMFTVMGHGAGRRSVGPWRRVSPLSCGAQTPPLWSPPP